MREKLFNFYDLRIIVWYGNHVVDITKKHDTLL